MKTPFFLVLFFGITCSSLGQTLSVYVSPYHACDSLIGGAMAYVSGGTPPYTYIWSTVPPQTTYDASDLTAGTYYITVTDSISNSVIGNVTINNVPGVECSICDIQGDTNGQGIGSITACAIGGTPPFQYAWCTGQLTPTVTNLSAGIYCLTISDVNSCWCTNCITVNSFATTTESISDNFISIYPNPASDNISIDFGKSNKSDYSIVLTNTLGQIIIRTKTTSASTQIFNIDLSALPKNIYYLSIYNRQMILNRKILIE